MTVMEARRWMGQGNDGLDHGGVVGVGRTGEGWMGIWVTGNEGLDS